MADKGKKVGVVTHYYTKLGVGIVKLDVDLKVGDKVRFEGAKTKFEQPIQEMELEHKKVEVAKKGQEVGVKLVDRVREKDKVFLVS
jgi:putative protease